MSQAYKYNTRRTHRGSTKVTFAALIVLVVIILSGVSFSVYTVRQIDKSVVSPYLAIINNHLGINPKLLKVISKLQDYELNPSARNLKKMKIGYRINKASILNDLQSKKSTELHLSFGSEDQLQDFIRKLKDLENDFDRVSDQPEQLILLRHKLEDLYKEWNFYSRKVTQKVQVAQAEKWDDWKQQLKLQLYFLLLISVTSILAISLIYFLYRKQHRTGLKLEQQKIELNDARILAEESTAAKTRFLANMSHEIRTPLNGIIGLSRLANDRIENPEVKGYLENVVLSGKSLLKIINDILDISKIEANKIEIEHTDYQLAEVIKTLSATIGFAAKSKGIILHILVPPKLPEKLRGDPSKLLQIIINLCSNAIKFTEQGSVTVRFSFVKKGSDAYLSVEVKDTGIGLTQKQQDKVFTDFVQADDSTTRRFGGTGLGLSISQKFAELMGGAITVHSEPNKGACFELSLPLEEQVLEAEIFSSLEEVYLDINTIENEQESEVPPLVLKDAQVLLVEDNKVNQLVAEQVLLDFGAVVTFANNGLECIEVLKKQSFDLILMDIQMPELDGIEATKIIIKEKLAPNTPIVALTANVLKEDIESYLNVGMSAHLPKPFEPEQLCKIASTLLHVD